jgi:hypothetical protein
MLGFFRGVERKFDSDPRATILSPLLGKREGSFRWLQKREFHVIADAGTNTLHSLGQNRCDCIQRGLAETGKKQVTVMERLSGRVSSQSANMTCSGQRSDSVNQVASRAGTLHWTGGRTNDLRLIVPVASSSGHLQNVISPSIVILPSLLLQPHRTRSRGDVRAAPADCSP